MAKKPQENLSKEMIDNIKSYANQIKTLKDFVTTVRKLPGMYIGSIGNAGFKNMIREIAQNGFDEINKPTSPCDRCWITYDERTCTTIVEDNGRGIPFDHIIRTFANEHTSSNYDKKPGEYSSGLHGVGAKVTNALSEKFIVESFILGEGRKVEFDEGYPWDKGEEKIPNDNKQGTRITFIPSRKAIGDVYLPWQEVRDLIALILPLSKIGAKVIFTGVDSNGKIYKDDMVNIDGIMTYMVNMTTMPLVKPIYLARDTGYLKMEILMTYDNSQSAISQLKAFANTCPTALGTHIDGFYDGVCYFFKNFMNKTYLAKSNDTGKKKKKQLTVTDSDIKTNLLAVVSVAHLNPIFDGQSKEKLSNEDMRPFVKNTTIELLTTWSKENVSDFTKVCKFLKDIAELRLKADAEKVKVTKKYSSSVLTGLPSKFVGPNGNKDLELWICEGDSAAGVMRNDRDVKTQGYFPIRGKIPNAMSTPREKFLSNPEISGILYIIFDGVKDFDINKVGKVRFDVSKIKWKYIVFGTDADVDGKHISALLLRFFVLYIPEVLEAGIVYQANPPLYGISKNNKMVYFLDKLEYVKYLQSELVNKHTISGEKNEKISNAELSKILYTNIDYIRELERIANRSSIHPEMLEFVLDLYIQKLTPKKFMSELKKAYRFISVDIISGGYIITGSAYGKIQTIILTDKFIADCNIIISIIKSNKYFKYCIDGNISSIYSLMKLFNPNPTRFERYKGLGEMNGPKLYESTLNKENRTLIRYTLTDAVKALQEIRYYANNKDLLLKDIKITRQDIMD